MLLSLVLGALVVLYPLAVWQLLERGRLDLAALVLVAAALLSALPRRNKTAWAGAAVALTLAAASVLFEVKNALKLYPVFINAALLAGFAVSLKGESVAERLARLREKNLPPYAVAYCRRVTVAWCVFFTVNGLVALDSALWRSDAWWGLYNGAISYGLIGVMFALEFAVRVWVRRRHERLSENQRE